MSQIEVFIQGEGARDIRLVTLPHSASMRDVILAARAAGLAVAGDADAVAVFIEDSSEALARDATLEAAGVGHQGSLHVHRCAHIEVSVHYGNLTKERAFAPGATIGTVRGWATGPQGFAMTAVDAGEHVLQITGTKDRPDEDAHIGTLVTAPAHDREGRYDHDEAYRPHCALAFDLVATVRIEG
jgi:hypothetical protein